MIYSSKHIKCQFLICFDCKSHLFSNEVFNGVWIVRMIIVLLSFDRSPPPLVQRRAPAIVCASELGLLIIDIKWIMKYMFCLIVPHVHKYFQTFFVLFCFIQKCFLHSCRNQKACCFSVNRIQKNVNHRICNTESVTRSTDVINLARSLFLFFHVSFTHVYSLGN